MSRLLLALSCLLLMTHGCSPIPLHLKYRATGAQPEVLAAYMPWFGHPRHISVGYSSHDPAVIRKQIRAAKSMGISAFVVVWYGDREPFNDASYALVQKIAAEERFRVAMMYDESDAQDGATDETLADFKTFHDKYLVPDAAGPRAYLTYGGRPIIFIFPGAGHTDWDRIRTLINGWNPQPLLIQENLPEVHASAFDGFYAWVQPGPKGWASDGSNWGAEYLSGFYQTMIAKYPDKMAIGGAWASFDDGKASWSQNRHMSARCGNTFRDTLGLWRQFYPVDQPIPFMMIDTWNDYEEGTAVEPGIPTCSDMNNQQPR